MATGEVAPAPPSLKKTSNPPACCCHHHCHPLVNNGVSHHSFQCFRIQPSTSRRRFVASASTMAAPMAGGLFSLLRSPREGIDADTVGLLPLDDDVSLVELARSDKCAVKRLLSSGSPPPQMLTSPHRGRRYGRCCAL